ncbi:FHA domain-containing protein [Pseudonocardia hierapolitana]|uniref:FHA domain-containing protein n=1 Tax=Pseudonocardia hierapolitana TaxID=1128676 RepID=A0A561SHX5_9PSEU|nr:FHA domain-containing protein [Pseudonocardia hierapolitana]TWF74489.1 FHA domain-containing protein [Pseudonocardia hierapolitana]
MDFDALRAAVVPGAGVVGRWPGVVCVAECADRNVLRQLLDVCATAAGHEPGRALARRLAMWLGGADAPGDGLRFGTVAVTGSDPRSGSQRGEQWAVFLYGPVGLVVPDRQVALSGAQSVAWTDRLLPRPDAPVVLALEGGPIPPGLVDGVHDLRAGVVPGAGAVLVPSGDHGSAEVADEAARTRQADSRWLDVAGGDRQWGADPAPTPSAEAAYPAEGAGNGLPSRGLGSLESYHPGDPGNGAERPVGRAHLRPVPSGSNGVAHRGWVPRRGSVSDLGRVSDTDHDQVAATHDDGPVETDGPDDLREPEVEKTTDNGRNGVRSGGGVLNGAAYDLLGGPEAPAQETERSPWSDDRGRDTGRPERIEGWFAAPEGGTEAGMTAIGPSDRRRRRHRLPDDDPSAGSEAGNSRPEAPADERGDIGDERGSDEYASADIGADPAAFGSGSVDETRIGSIPPIAAEPAGPPADGESPDGDGTPRLGVPAQAPPVHPLADAGAAADGETPHTTALRSERILGAPDEQELEDGTVTGGLAVDDRPEDPAPRPPVGLLVFDDGATYTVDAEYLMGRMPEADPRVASGALRSLALEDPSGAVSRVHAQIVLNGWEALLVDVGSRNGTFVSPPGEQGWTQLPAGETHLLVPGTRVRIGGRSFQFEAPSGTR